MEVAAAQGASKKRKPQGRDHAAIAAQFETDVLEGRFPCGQLFRAAVERQRRDLASPPKGYVFSPEAGARACRFAELLNYPEGPKRGEPFRLEAWESWFLFVLFGWIDPVTGFRRFRVASVWLPKGNGKSPLAAIVALYILCTSREGPKCFSAATSQKQARLVFSAAQEMLRLSPKIEEKFSLKVEEHKIRGVDDNRCYEPVSSEAGTIEGIRPSLIILDEVHVLATRKLYDNLKSACNKVDGALLFLISTAGFDSSPDAIGWQQFTRARDILLGAADEPTTFALVAHADEGDDPYAEATWRKANPNFGISVSVIGLREAAKTAQEVPSERPSFFTKHLNWWVQGTNRWMDMAKWDACANPKLRREDFAGRTCVIGLDLATRRDFCAKVLVFPEQRPDGSIGFVVFCDAFQNASAAQPFLATYAEYMTVTPGEVTDLRVVQASVHDDAQRFNVAEVCIDKYFAAQIEQDMQDHGLQVVEIPQTVPFLSPAMKATEAAIYSGALRHDGNPLLRYFIGNVVARTDANDNVFPRHEEGRHIDGASALFDAMVRAALVAGITKLDYAAMIEGPVLDEPQEADEDHDWIAL